MHAPRHLLSAVALAGALALGAGCNRDRGPTIAATTALTKVGVPGTLTLQVTNPGRRPLVVDGIDLGEFESGFFIDGVDGAPPVRNTFRQDQDCAVDLVVQPGRTGTITVQLTPAVGANGHETVELCVAGRRGCELPTDVHVWVEGSPVNAMALELTQVIEFDPDQVVDLTSGLDVAYRGVSTNAESATLLVLTVRNHTLHPQALDTSRYAATQLAWVWEEPDPLDTDDIQNVQGRQITNWPVGADTVWVPAQGELTLEAELFAYPPGGVDWQFVGVCLRSGDCATVRR